MLQTWQRVFVKLWIHWYTSQVRSLPKRSVNASHMITYHMLFNASYNLKKKNKNRLFLLLTYTEQQGQIFLNSSSGYFFAEAVSSSFRTNFFLSASEIRVAESSSLRDVQPLLYLQTPGGFKKKKKNPIRSLLRVLQGSGIGKWCFGTFMRPTSLYSSSCGSCPSEYP